MVKGAFIYLVSVSSVFGVFLVVFFLFFVPAEPTCNMYSTNNKISVINKTNMKTVFSLYVAAAESQQPVKLFLVQWPSKRVLGWIWLFLFMHWATHPFFNSFLGREAFHGTNWSVQAITAPKCSRRASLSIFLFPCLLPSSNTQAVIIIRHIK